MSYGQHRGHVCVCYRQHGGKYVCVMGSMRDSVCVMGKHGGLCVLWVAWGHICVC